RLLGAGMSSFSPIVIRYRVPKDPREPGDCALVVTDLGTMFHGLQIGRLEDVLGSRPVFNACGQKTQKLHLVSGNTLYSRRETGGVGRNFIGRQCRLLLFFAMAHHHATICKVRADYAGSSVSSRSEEHTSELQ